MTDRDPLSSLLSNWQPEPTPAPDFATTVQARLAAQPAVSPLARVLQFPATLPLAAGFAVMLGIASALTISRTETQSRLADAYARSIDPVRMTSVSHHP